MSEFLWETIGWRGWFLASDALFATSLAVGMTESELPVSILLCVATPLEGALLRERLAGADGVEIVETGVGVVNASHALTVAILRNRPARIICCGVGGAYPGAGLRIGDVVCAENEVYGDLGAQSPNGFLDMQALGFPVVAQTPPLYNEMPMQVFPAGRRVRFVTVSTCTGSDAVAREIETRTNGAVENMEGAAIAHVAYLHNVPVGELRAISNIVSNRDRSTWRLREAAESAQHTLCDWLRVDALRP
jgi:futalosine hydrolase